MASIREYTAKDGSVSYAVTIRMKGYKTQCATFKRKTDAKRWAQQTEAAMYEGRHFRNPEAKKRTLAELIDRYKAEVLSQRETDRAKVNKQLDWWRQELGFSLLIDLTPIRLSEYRDKIIFHERKANGEMKAPATVLRYLSSLSHVFSVALKDWGWMDENPMLKVRKPKLPRGRARILSDDERQRLLTACKASPSPFLYPLVVLALSTGARSGEMTSLRWHQVDFTAGVIRLDHTKNGDRRTIPLRGHAAELLKNLRKIPRIDTDLVFPREDGKRPICLQKHWYAALKEARINDFRFHDLRHTAASYMMADGATLVQLSEILGHRTLQMVKRYTHLTEQQACSVVEKMNRRIFSDG